MRWGIAAGVAVPTAAMLGLRPEWYGWILLGAFATALVLAVTADVRAAFALEALPERRGKHEK